MKLTRRGRVVVALLLSLAVAGIYYIATRMWWIDGSYCFDTLTNCMLREHAPVDGVNS